MSVMRLAAALLAIGMVAAGCKRAEKAPAATVRPQVGFELTGTVKLVQYDSEAGARARGTTRHGWMAIALASHSDPVGKCGFIEGNAVPVYFVDETTFEPANVTEAGDFPENLDGRSATVTGTIDEASRDDCVFNADKVVVSDRPAATPKPGRSPRASATPTPRATAPSTPTPTPTHTPTASPSATSTP